MIFVQMQKGETMSDYISRQAAVEALEKATCSECTYNCPDPYSKKCGAIDKYSAGIRIINSLTSADVMEVIRCKDCKHFATINEPYDETFCRLCFMNKSEMGYCDKAERRTDG